MSWWVSLETPVVAPHLEVNITYNVGTMLRRAGIHPNIINGMGVEDATEVFKHAVLLMSANPDYFREFDAKNGWGTFETTFEAVNEIYRALLKAEHDVGLKMRWS